MTVWAYLPNAAHIDRVLASVTADPDHWVAAWQAVRDVAAWQAVRDQGRDAARYKLRDQGRDAAYDAAWWAVWEAVRSDAWATSRNIAWYAARDTLRAQGREAAWQAAARYITWVARDAILALVAFDDCAYMLDSEPGELAILAKFGDHRAMLLLEHVRQPSHLRN